MVKVYSHTERMQILRETAKRVTATPQSRREFLQRAGILDKNGNLAPQYR